MGTVRALAGKFRERIRSWSLTPKVYGRVARIRGSKFTGNVLLIVRGRVRATNEKAKIKGLLIGSFRIVDGDDDGDGDGGGGGEIAFRTVATARIWFECPPLDAVRRLRGRTCTRSMDLAHADPRTRFSSLSRTASRLARIPGNPGRCQHVCRRDRRNPSVHGIVRAIPIPSLLDTVRARGRARPVP